MHRLTGVRALLLTAALFASAAAGGAAQEATPEASPVVPAEGGIQLVQVIGGLDSPRVIVSANDGTGRLFIGERWGLIRILTADGELLSEPFLDLTDVVLTSHADQGILGIAFPPDYAQSGLVYVAYTDVNVNGTVVVAQFQVSPDNPNVALRESAVDIIKTQHPTATLNGGTIRFGPDGYLYLGIGNGGYYGIHDLLSAQEFDSHLGKVLRLQVGFTDGRYYEIPPDNPYSNTFEYWHAQHVWLMGLRNPWGFDFDPLTGDLYVPDRGDSAWEEINLVPAGTSGQNFGWPLWEGTQCVHQEPPGGCPAFGTPPIREYSHDEGCSVVGLGVYRGAALPELDGAFLTGDYCSGKIWALSQADDGAWQFPELLDTGLNLTGGGRDEAGELYVLSCACELPPDSDGVYPGSVWRIVSAKAIPSGAEIAPTDG